MYIMFLLGASKTESTFSIETQIINRFNKKL